MIKRILVTVLSGMLLTTAFGFQAIHAQTAVDTQRVERVRSQVARIWKGKKARVHVRLQDNTKLKGSISDVSQDSFTFNDSQTGRSRTLAYTDVAEVTKQKGGISNLTWGLIAGAAVAAIIVGVTVIKPVLCDGC